MKLIIIHIGIAFSVSNAQILMGIVYLFLTNILYVNAMITIKNFLTMLRQNITNKMSIQMKIYILKEVITNQNIIQAKKILNLYLMEKEKIGDKVCMRYIFKLQNLNKRPSNKC